MANQRDQALSGSCTWLVQSLDFTPRYITNPNPEIGYAILSATIVREDAHVWFEEGPAAEYAKRLGSFYVARRARP